MSSLLVHKFDNGVLLPAVMLGCWELKGDAPTTPESINAALKFGYYGVDDADIYGNEQVVGPIVASFNKEMFSKSKKLEKSDLKVPEGNEFQIVGEKEFFDSFSKPHGKPEDDRCLFVTTKVWCTNFNPDGIRDTVKRHLKHFNRSSIDLLLLHWPGDHTWWATEEQMKNPKNKLTRKICWKTFEDLYAEGKVRAIGVSNYSCRHMTELLEDIAKRKSAGDKNTMIPMVNQIYMNAHTKIDPELEDLCRKNKIHLTSYSTLGSARSVELLMGNKVVREIAKSHGVDPALVLLRYGLEKGYSVLPRSTKSERVISNYDVVKLSLSHEDMEKLSNIYDPADRGPDTEQIA